MIINRILLLIFRFLDHRVSAPKEARGGGIEKRGERGGDTIQLDPYTPGAIVRALYSLWRYSLKMPNTLLPDPIVSFSVM